MSESPKGPSGNLFIFLTSLFDGKVSQLAKASVYVCVCVCVCARSVTVVSDSQDEDID